MKIFRFCIAASLAFAITIATSHLQAQTITHSVDPNTVAGGGVACVDNTTGFLTDNSWWRVFDLDSFGIFTPWQIDSVDLGIGSATAATPGLDIPGFLNFYLDPGGDDGLATPGDLMLIGTISIDIPDGTTDSIINFAGGPTLAAGSTFALEFFMPGRDTGIPGNNVRVGVNDLGETDDTFLSADACGIPRLAPISTGSIGFPGSQMVVSINGTAIPEPTSIALLGLCSVGLIVRRRRS